MSDRFQRIIRLLETRDDGLPGIRAQRVHTTSGFVHDDATLSCEDCTANGAVLKGCESCHGTGRVLVKRDRDPYAVDVVLPYGMNLDRHEKRRARDSELARLAGQTAEPRSEADLLASIPPEPWEVERRRMYRAFDYAALDLALDELRNHDEGSYHALHSVFIFAWSEPSVSLEVAVQHGLRFIDPRMPDPIRAPGMESRHPALERRDKRRAAATTSDRISTLTSPAPAEVMPPNNSAASTASACTDTQAA